MKNGVILNHWGGVPRCAQPSLCTLKTTAESVVLTHYDKAASFAAVLSDTEIFWHLKKLGYRIAIVGPTGMHKSPGPPRVFPGEHLPDACTTLQPDVDYCSAHADELEENALCHDARVLEEARHFVQQAGPQPFLIIVNLLSCRDVDRLRVGSVNPLVNVCTLSPCAAQDPRIIPKCLHSRPLGEFGQQLAQADLELHGEPPTTRVEENYYASLLGATLRTLSELEPYTAALLDCCDAEVAVTCTHSLAIGEHGIRGGMSPTHVCSETFWSTTCADVTPRQGLQQNLAEFAAAISNDTLRLPEEVQRTIGPGFSRRLCHVHERKYSIVESSEGDLIAVFDGDADPHETTNILPVVTHLKPHFQGKRSRAPKQPDPSPTARLAQEAKPLSTSAAKNLRQKESRLNKLHR